jgi:glycosyltransferase involved in cell wall biosynthesis
MSKVSIIIPAYKQAAYLGKTIESALAQTHSDVEVVVIDDGSPDETPEVAARFSDQPNFKYVRQENTGLGGARNRGIAVSTGEYLCFLDADDQYLPQKVAKQVALLERNPKLGFAYCDLTTIDEHDKPVADQFHVANLKRELSGDIFPALITGGYFPPHTVMIRRSVLDEVGMFDLELGGHADYELWLRVSGAFYEAVFIPERLVLYRRHSDNMSKDGQHMGETRLATLQKITKLYPERAGRSLEQLQQMVAEMGIANNWLQRKIEQSPSYRDVTAVIAVPEIDKRELQKSVAWRAKLEAGNTLIAENQPKAAAKVLLEGIKAVETCKNPSITLEAVVEISEKLAPIDSGRAAHLLKLAVKMAERLQAAEMLQKAQYLLTQIGSPTASRN